ncbi:Metalloenzyme, LuxS/M16 peptidase-like protein [Fimicolochytrium jonesii]|uniref:Metalloenzyme, LuxS/M16 peptidase-like protein n=1 Tax=Fimicolochytrium jonesii TaxID=1396493 RepID=UPI0022FDD331|nr:Metalloenzyme, LuxS/M16 peptidase-like protein [Fimicolochytrium jonesii]KAI8825682.1 Metalloenzyme, LuxS/M16 peptidase-like protein [Fimicolochytrium jonesii]
MLCKAVRPLVRAAAPRVQTRTYAVLSEDHSAVTYNRKGDQVAAAPSIVKTVTQTASGIRIATVDHLGPVSTVALVVKAGSRNESPDAPGVAHFFKNSLVRNVPGDTITRTVRETELRGDTLYAAHTREQLIVASDFLRDNLVDAVPLLFENFFNTHHYPYEFLHTRPHVIEQASASLADPTVKVFDSLHQAAFRHGLGNSLFATAPAAKALKRAHLHEFAAKYFTADRIAVVGSGVAHKDLQPLVEEAITRFQDRFGKSSVSVPVSKFRGGEIRIEAGPKAESHYAVAFPAVAFSDPLYPAALVLRAILDGSKRAKWGNASGSAGALASAATAKTSVTAFEAAYSDAGLIGFYVQGSNSDVKDSVGKAIAALKETASKVSEEALSRGKKIAIVDAESALSRDVAIQEIAKQVLVKGDVAVPADLAAAIKKVTAADVQKVAKTATAAKPAVVAYGNLLKLPFADELSI